MIIRGNFGICATALPGKSKPVLCVYDKAQNKMTKVASFDSGRAMMLYLDVLRNHILSGFLEPDDEGKEDGRAEKS